MTWGRGARAVWLGVLVLATGCATLPAPPGSDMAYRQRARRRELALTWGRAPVPPTQRAQPELEHGEPTAPSHPPVPEGWPEEASSDEELLGPFQACRSVGEFLALQRTVDMVRVVERLGDWSAVRLGALGPLMDAKASQVLTGKRASFLLQASQDYGAFAQVFALFVVHSAFDDELAALLRLLARDKQLGQTLGHMEAVRQELERRGLTLSDSPERGERAGDVLRGLGRAATDVLNSTPASDGARYQSILRHSLKQRVQVQRVRLVYQGGELIPMEPKELKNAVNVVQASVPGVEVRVQ